MSKNIVEIYFKGNKKKTVEVKIKSTDDIKNLISLCKSEIFRRSFLADLDYEDNCALTFKVDGEKTPVQALLKSCMKVLDESDDDNDYKEHKKDKDKKKKKHKKDKDKKDKKKKKKKKNHDSSYNNYESERSYIPSRVVRYGGDNDGDNCIAVHRIKKEYYY